MAQEPFGLKVIKVRVCFVRFCDGLKWGVDTCEMAPCRFDDGCWRPLCPYRHRGKDRAGMWTRVWLTLAAVETEWLAPQGRGVRVHAGCCQRDVTDGVRPPWIFPVDVVSQSVRVQQWTAEQIGDVPQFRYEAVDEESLVPRERVQWSTVEQSEEVPQFRDETAWSHVNECNSGLPSELEMGRDRRRGSTETASQDRRLQRTVERALVDHVEAERMCEHFGVIEVSKNSSQENVQIVNIVPHEQRSGRTGEQIGVIEMPKIFVQESVVVANVPQEQSSERKGEQIGVIE